MIKSIKLSIKKKLEKKHKHAKEKHKLQKHAKDLHDKLRKLKHKHEMKKKLYIKQNVLLVEKQENKPKS